MEKRKGKVIFTKSGAGSRTTRVTIPVSWIDKLNINQDDREINLYHLDNKIIISKDDIEEEKKGE